MHWLSHDLPFEFHQESDALSQDMDIEEARAFCVSLLQDVGDLEGAQEVNSLFLELGEGEEEGEDED
jgi:hypothetical protein